MTMEQRRIAETLDLAATMVRDADGTIRQWSAGCERLYGFTAAEAIGRTAHELLQTEFPATVIEDALRRDGEWSGGLRQHRKDGTPILVLTHLALEPPVAGGRFAVIENSIDATQWHSALAAARQRQARLEEAMESLHAQVAELQRQLVQAQKMEAVGQLTSSVAHDFNNFLTVVLANAALLRATAEAAGSAREVRRAKMIERAGERGARLASQLLAFTRKQTLFPETAAVEPLLAGMHELLLGAAGSGNELRIRCAPDVCAVRVDPIQLESALLNLVINARDAMPADGGAITITADNVTLNLAAAVRLRLPPGEFARIAVADEGSGIAPEVLERVFEPFFTTKAAGKGSGLGLTQVHGFVGQSGGAVHIESEVGRGTTVSLLLPRAPAPLAEHPADAPAAEAAGNGRSVLLVEDQEDLREMARMMLEEHGYQVMAAPDAEAAREILAGGKPIHVLFADLVLPGGMTGIELARVARRLRPDIGVLLTSGYTRDTPDRRGADARELQFLLKPYATDKLLARMTRLAAGAVPPPLTWSAAHNVGIREIDEQHARLGELLNELASVLRSGEDPAAALREVIRYTEFHFADEERLMAEHDYHATAAHEAMHRRLLDEIGAFRPGIDGVSVGLALDYLEDWLLRHVDEQDRELAKALRARGMR
jgi:hemerythrin-like metal-binding protein/PAS domain S-box-containing protein